MKTVPDYRCFVSGRDHSIELIQIPSIELLSLCAAFLIIGYRILLRWFSNTNIAGNYYLVYSYR